MDMLGLLLVPSSLAVFCIAWIYYHLMLTFSNKKPALPPGPPGLPIVGNLPFLEPELNIYFARLARHYGPVLKLRLGSKIGIVVTSQSAAREILREKDIVFANRDVPATGRVAMYGANDIVWNPYGPEWRMLRKVCVLKMLSNSTLDSVAPLRCHEIRNTVRYIHSKSGSPVNVGEQIFLLTLNVVTNMMWGGSVQGEEERSRIAAEFRQVVGEIIDLLAIPNISDFFPSLARFDLQGLVKKTNRLHKKIDDVFNQVIEQRLRGDDDCDDDFLGFLMRLIKDEGGGGGDPKTPNFTHTHLKALFMDMVLAGSDTSSNSVEFSMAELMKNPEVMKRAQQELDDVVGRDNIVEEAHIHMLPYLKAIMKESLRLHPTIPLMVPHSPSESITVAGYHVPAGSRVFVNVWAIHRDPSIWADPLKFDPDRFFNVDDHSDFTGTDFGYLPFGSGRRSCAGIAMAERMVLYTLATLLHCFKWNLVDGHKFEVEEKFGMVLKLKDPLIVIPTPRLLDPTLY